MTPSETEIRGIVFWLNELSKTHLEESWVRDHMEAIVDEVNRIYQSYLEGIIQQKELLDNDTKKTRIFDARKATKLSLRLLAPVPTRSSVQELACQRLGILIVTFVCHKRPDVKTRQLFVRLLSNLWTENTTVASFFTRGPLTLAPSADEVENSLRQMVVENEPALGDVGPGNWVDLILQSSRDRETLADALLALHNCIQASPPAYTESLSQNSLLLSTLLRHAISSTTLGSDHATDILVILLTHIVHEGYLANIYQAVGASSTHTMTLVTPEQIVLLRCLLAATESQKDVKDFAAYNGDTLLFLANTQISLSDQVHICTMSDTSDQALCHAAALLILEILAEILSHDTTTVKQHRILLGEESSIIQSTSSVLGQLVDNFSQQNEGKKVREMRLSDDDQAHMVVMVRLLGNLSFRCRQNQDLLRTTLVPSTHASDRSALHVLLSCTSISHACFTLREWSLVAIRYVLEDNDANKIIVADLEAQHPVQNASLQDLGIQVNMDKYGKVSVSPIADEEEKGSGTR